MHTIHNTKPIYIYIYIYGFFLVLILGTSLISCEDAAGETAPVILPDFSVTNTYIDFHSYRAKVTLNFEGTQEVSFVLSEDATPPDLTKLDTLSYIVRKFTKGDATLGTRKIYLGWTDALTSANYTTALTPTSLVNIATENDYTSKVPFLLRKNTPYYLHIYYTKDGAAKTQSQSFKTPDYPNNATDAEKMFPGDILETKIDGMKLFMGRAVDLMDIERKSTEPAIMNMFHWGQPTTITGTIYFFYNSTNIITATGTTVALDSNSGLYIIMDDTRNMGFHVTAQTGQLLSDWILLFKTSLTLGTISISEGTNFYNLVKYIVITE